MAMLGPNFDCGYLANEGYSSTVSEFDGYAGGLYMSQMCRNIVTCRNLVIDTGNIKAFLMVILSGIVPLGNVGVPSAWLSLRMLPVRASHKSYSCYKNNSFNTQALSRG
jgi:hypothetical protein